MCEKEPKRRSCTTCPQYDGMKCTATDFTLGDRDEVLQQEHRRGFICLDTGEAELKGDAVLRWTAEQERISQEKGYKSVGEMWAAEGKQVMSGVHIDEDNEHLEPILQISNDPGPIKLTFQYKEKAKATDWPQYKGLECKAADAWTRDNGIVPQAANVKSVDDTMYHPNQPENQQWYTVEARANIGVDLDLLREHNPNIKVIRASELEAGSPSSECPSRRDGPPQKGKIDENEGSHNALRLSCIRHPESRCDNCKKSQKEDGKLHCYQWGIQILMPHRPCEKWALDPAKSRCDDQNEVPSLYKEVVSPEPKAGDLVIVPGSSICSADDVLISEQHAEDNCITYVSNTPKSNAVFTDEEISQLKDAMHTMQRILEQHGVTL